MEMFTEAEIKEIESMEDLKDMMNVLDSILDGEVFKIRNTDTDKTIDIALKPVLPKGLVDSEKASSLKNKKIYAYVLQILIALLIELNPKTTEFEDDYCLRLAIIVNAITSGCIAKNDNWVYSDITFDNNFIKKEGKKYFTKNKALVKQVQDMLNPAFNFIAFSSMNMVRFNHHFPIEKINLISKSLNSIPEEQRDRFLEEEKLDTFYNQLVTAARIINDKKFYEKYILKRENGINMYYYYECLGAYDLQFEEEIIKLRQENTPNGFLILDIINEIYNDIKSRNVLFAIPYRNEIAELLKIRNYIRKNPFGYHPAKHFYKCVAEDYDQVVGKFQNIMKRVGSFVFQYSEQMYESVRNAKCRDKYGKNVLKDDENLIKALNSITKVDVNINKETIELAKKKLSLVNIEIKEETDIKKLNKKFAEEMENEIKTELKF